MLYGNAILMAKAHVAWEKYALLLLAVLWLLKAAKEPATAATGPRSDR
jgi:hypothetical protein